MSEIAIVKYDPIYAQSLADMWSESGENWGYNHVTTAESVIKEQERSSQIDLYLAICGGKVVGSCNFAIYEFDENALYIPVLNVHPGYHGRKIGKALVIKIVEESIKHELPRLDLFTDSGNAKAVPLYKKAGFIWEDMDNETHFMNFIPSALKTEALKSHFEKMDWYKDRQLEIEIAPDGFKKNDFEFYEYVWSKDNHSLHLNYERKGRGLVLIETEDYRINMYSEKQKCIFGRNHKVYFQVVNIKGNPLKIEIEGRNQKNIEFNFNYSKNIEGSEIIESEFLVHPVDVENNYNLVTTPRLEAVISINGLRADFALGIIPVFPVSLSLKGEEGPVQQERKHDLFLDVENNFDCRKTFEFRLPDSDTLLLDESVYDISLNAFEKKSINVSATVKDFGWYGSKIMGLVKSDDGNDIHFSKTVGLPFSGGDKMFDGHNGTHYVMSAGPYTIKLDCVNNCNIVILYKDSKRLGALFVYPQVGKPFSRELSRRKPDRITSEVTEGNIISKVEYDMQNFKNVQLNVYHILSSSGRYDMNFEVINYDKDETKNISVSNIFRLSAVKTIPYNNRIIELKDEYFNDFGSWDTDKLTDNWLFGKSRFHTYGVCWHDSRIDFNDEDACFQNDFTNLQPGESIKRKGISFFIDMYPNWQEFASANTRIDKKSKSCDPYIFSINKGNPFVKADMEGEFEFFHEANEKGVLKLSSLNSSLEEKNVILEEGMRDIKFQIRKKGNNLLDVAKLEIGFESVYMIKKSLLLYADNSDICFDETEEEGMKVMSVSNSLFTVTASNDYGTSLYSMKEGDYQWLHSNFPKREAFDPWNPWSGGIYYSFSDFEFTALQRNESRKTSFTELIDNFGNNWKGIKISINVEKNKKYQGLFINQYYLMVPGSAVLCTFLEIDNKSGRYFPAIGTCLDAFMKPDEDLKNCFFEVLHTKENRKKFFAGYGEICFDADKILSLGSTTSNKKLLMIGGDILEGEVDTNTMIGCKYSTASVKDNEVWKSDPTFFISTDIDPKDMNIDALFNIKFDS